MKTGLFLTPGAARGAYQAGAAQVLVQEGGIHFDVVATCSVGSVNGAFVATGQVDQLVEVWANWRTRDVVRVDWRALLRGAFWWATSLMTNQPEKDVIQRHVHESRLRPGVRFRLNVADLVSGEQEILEWPGSPVPLAEGVEAAVAVPVVIPPVDFDGAQWVDGLTIDGFPLEQLLLETGVDRAFVVGVAPHTASDERYRNPLKVLLRAVEWNQFSETVVGLQRSEAVNQRTAAWAELRQRLEDEVASAVADPQLRAEAMAELDRRFDDVAFPYRRGAVQVVPILPERETRMLLGDFRPRRSRALIEQGRRDARRALAALADAQTGGSA